MAAIVLLTRNDRSPSPTPLDVRGFLSLGITFAALLLDHNLSAAQLTLGDRVQTPGVLAAFQAVFTLLAVVSLANALVGASLARTAPQTSEAPAGNLAFC